MTIAEAFTVGEFARLVGYTVPALDIEVACYRHVTSGRHSGYVEVPPYEDRPLRALARVEVRGRVRWFGRTIDPEPLRHAWGATGAALVRVDDEHSAAGCVGMTWTLNIIGDGPFHVADLRGVR